MRSRILIIVFDALRPEFLTADLMPNLHGFARHGVLCTDHHSTFPTEPRVNQSSVTTGCYPRKHGIVANLFPMPGVDGILNTGDDAAFEAMIGDLREPLFGVPQMADILATHGRSYASISAGTPGGARLINLNAQSYGYMRYALRRPAASVPRGLSDRIAEVVGPIPDNTRPMVDWNRHAVDAWLEVIAPQEPDVSLVWLCEPDESFHWHEIGSPESRAAAHGVDAAFGEILHRKRDEIASGNLQIIALSDHGQISLSGGKIGLEGKARAAGFKLDSPSPDYLF
ncbi:MAG: alkaline phosphatase family protein [Paracoccaceae bacterium]